MKKLTLIISALALVLGMSQCKKPNMPEYDGPVGGRVIQNVTLNASRGNNSDSNSKVSYDEEELVEGKWIMKLNWDENDEIIAYDSKGYCGTLSIKLGFESPNGVFEGMLNVTKDSDVKFYYFGKKVIDNGDHSYSVDFGTQKGRITTLPEDPLDIIGKLVLVGTSSYKSDGKYSTTMGIPFSIVKINFEGFGDGNIEAAGLAGTGFTIANTGVLTMNKNTSATFVDPGTTDFYAVFMPKSDGKDIIFRNTGHVAKKPWTLDANTFYTKEHSSTGEAVVVTGETPASEPVSVKTEIGCYGIVYSCGGKVELTEAQDCEVGVVYSETVYDPKVGLEGCNKISDIVSLPSGTTPFNVDIVELQTDHKYYVRAYAIGENSVVVYATEINEVEIGKNAPQMVNWNGGGISGASPKLFTAGRGVDGDFGTDDDLKVRFSQGNLQFYTGGNKKWRLTDHQVDMVDGNTADEHLTSIYEENTNKWIDLFAWGTSGQDHGAVCYQPWSTSSDNDSYNAYGDNAKNLYDSPYTADWGYNTVYVGSVATSGWRTMNKSEWQAILEDRPNASNLRGLGMVGNCTKGLIVLPDDWTDPGLGFTPSTSGWVNVYSYSDWAKMEAAGAVFLPAAGYRYQSTIKAVGAYGHYWTSTGLIGNYNSAYRAEFTIDYLTPYSSYYGRIYGYSVRLVRDEE